MPHEQIMQDREILGDRPITLSKEPISPPDRRQSSLRNADLHRVEDHDNIIAKVSTDALPPEMVEQIFGIRTTNVNGDELASCINFPVLEVFDRLELTDLQIALEDHPNIYRAFVEAVILEAITTQKDQDFDTIINSYGVRLILDKRGNYKVATLLEKVSMIGNPREPGGEGEELYGVSFKNVLEQASILKEPDDRLQFVEEVLGLLHPLAIELDHLHHLNLGPKIRGIIHRDVKPSNILIGERRVSGGSDLEQYWRWADFGTGLISRQTNETRDILGTPQYMAPELMKNRQEGTPQGDVYSIGVMLLELIAGEEAFDYGNRNDEPPNKSPLVITTRSLRGEFIRPIEQLAVIIEEKLGLTSDPDVTELSQINELTQESTTIIVSKTAAEIASRLKGATDMNPQKRPESCSALIQSIKNLIDDADTGNTPKPEWFEDDPEGYLQAVSEM